MSRLFSLGHVQCDELEKGMVKGADQSKPLELRDLSWDHVIYFVSGLLLGLASLGLFSWLIVNESGFVCDLSPYSDIITDENFVLSVCERSVPVHQFFPAVILAQALVILLPHLFWKSQFHGQFASFFGKVKGLDQVDGTGFYSYRNKSIISKMKTTFLTYNKSFIFFWYKVKLVVQLLLIAASIAIATTIDELSNFENRFNCTPQEGIDWPLGNATPTCILTSTHLLQLTFLLDLILLAVTFPILLWGLIWCFKRHPMVLGIESKAKFSFFTGLPQELYVPKPVFSGLSEQCYKWRKREFFTELNNRFIQPNIANDFEFLVILLSSLDDDLGSTFREGEVILELQKLYQNDQQELEYDDPSSLGCTFTNPVCDKSFKIEDYSLVIPHTHEAHM